MIKEMFLSQDKLNLKAPYSMVPKGICIHNTYNDAPAINERNNVNRPENMDKTSFHIAVDDKEAIQLIPFNRNAFHAGDGANGNGNRNYIAVEICYSLSGGARFEAAEARAVDVVVDLCKQFGFTPENIKPHRYFSGKNCPHRTNINSFIQRVGSKLISIPSPVAPPSNNLLIGDKIKIIGSHYSTGEVIPSWAKEQEYTIQQVGTGKVLIKELVSWVNNDGVVKVSGSPSPQPQPAPQSSGNITVGSKVKVHGSQYSTGQAIPGWVKEQNHTVQQIGAGKYLLKEIQSWVNASDVSLVGNENTPVKTLQVGSTVKVTGNRYATGQAIPSWVRERTYTVQQIGSDRVLLQEIQSWVYKSDIVWV